jgi:hypothetical protein
MMLREKNGLAGRENIRTVAEMLHAGNDARACVGAVWSASWGASGGLSWKPLPVVAGRTRDARDGDMGDRAEALPLRPEDSAGLAFAARSGARPASARTLNSGGQIAVVMADESEAGTGRAHISQISPKTMMRVRVTFRDHVTLRISRNHINRVEITRFFWWARQGLNL